MSVSYPEFGGCDGLQDIINDLSEAESVEECKACIRVLATILSSQRQSILNLERQINAMDRRMSASYRREGDKIRVENIKLEEKDPLRGL